MFIDRKTVTQGRNLGQFSCWRKKNHNRSWFDCSSIVPDTAQKEDLDLSFLSKRNCRRHFTSPREEQFPYLPFYNLLTSVFSCSGKKWLSEQVFTKVIKCRCATVRLVILYAGDISQDFLVYQQSAFFLLFHNFPDLHFLSHLKILILIPLIKRLTYQKTLLSWAIHK